MRLNRLLLFVAASVSCARHVSPPAPQPLTDAEYRAYEQTLKSRGWDWTSEYPLDPAALPVTTPVTLIVDGRPLPYHAVVIAHRTIPDTGLAGPFTRYKRTLFMWPEGGGNQLIMLRGSLFDEPMITPAEFAQDWCARLMTHACAPHVIQYAGTAVEGFGINGRASIGSADHHAPCGTTISERRIPAQDATCERVTYRTSLDVILADSGGVLDTYDTWLGNMPVRIHRLMYGDFTEHLVLPPTVIGGLEFTATCRAGVSPQWVCGDSGDRVAYARERGSGAEVPRVCTGRCAVMVDASPASSFRTLHVYGGTPPSASTMTAVDSTASRLQLRGMVQGEAGDPIADALVYVIGGGSNTRTDSLGMFTLVFPANADSGSKGTLAVYAAGYLNGRWPFTIGQDRVLPLSLMQDWRVGNFARFDPRSHPRAFYGVVKTEGGDPVVGATVSLNAVGTPTDSLGRYILVLPPTSKLGTRLPLYAKQIGYGVRSRRVTVGSSAVRVDFVLPIHACDIGCETLQPVAKPDSARRKPHAMD